MKTIYFILMGIAFSFFNSPLSQAASFVQTQVSAELKSPTPLTSTELEKAQSVQYIFVDGIFGDVFKSNFTPATQVLADDWNVTDYAVITPDTANPMTMNADITYNEIVKIRQASPHAEAVLTAHSKGATESLIMLLRHPELVTQMGIKTINLISGPHEGTDVVQFFDTCAPTNFVCGELNQLLPSVQGFVASVIVPVEMAAYNALSPTDQAEISSHIFYVETQMKDDDLSSPLLVPHFYLNDHGGPNDGLIPTANEVFRPNGQIFGNDLGIMHGDHNSLMSKAITSDNKVFRHTFFQVLIKNTLLLLK